MNSSALVECVPNFSEGRKKPVIDAIAKAISDTAGCYLLDVDPGVSTNRTVYTFVGHPEHVLNGALAAARCGFNLIDMQEQHGEHPRVGAMDVCPFIPIRNVTMEECVELSKRFAKLLADELNVPIYLYGESQPNLERKELSQIRQGEYESLRDRFDTRDTRLVPDFGPCKFVPRFGACCVGARSFLIAYNVNVLGTKEQAHRIALNIREQGRSETEPGRCKKVKAIGWWLDEENMAQISMNLVDYKTTNLHEAFEECQNDAKELNLSLCGSQIVGLIPLDSILQAAEFYIKKEKLLILEESNKVKLVINRLGLNSISQFNPKERIIEYLIEERLESQSANLNKYLKMSIENFVGMCGARTSIPGGGCVSALVASLGSSLACMVSFLTYGNRKFEKFDAQVRDVLPHFYNSYNDLMKLIDQDALAFESYVEARKLPYKTEEQRICKELSSKNAMYRCIEVPYTVVRKAYELWPYLLQLAPIFNMETKSDLLVAIKCLETGIYGAYENVLINSKYFNEYDEKVEKICLDSKRMWLESKSNIEKITTLIDSRAK